MSNRRSKDYPRLSAHNEDKLLAQCYRNSLRLAVHHNIRTIAFPSISTGAYRFPVDRAARIALQTMTEMLQELPTIEKVFCVCFDQHTYDAYQRAAQALEAGTH